MIQPQAKLSIFARSIGELKNYWAYLALLLGASFGILFYSYWLVDHFPPISKQVLLYTILAGLVGSAGYYLLLERCIAPLLFRPTKASRWGLVIGSLLIGLYLAFAYLNIQGSPARYIAFLLPRQNLSISVSGAPEAEIAIQRFTTSLGDISYNNIRYQGWTRRGSDLVLTNPSSNSLKWTGTPGEEAVVTLRVSAEGGKAEVSWNGDTQNVNISGGADGRYELAHDFPVPFYASQIFLLLLGALNFVVLCLTANLVIWKNRTLILTKLEGSFSDLLHPIGIDLEDTGNESRTTVRVLRREWLTIACLVVLALLLRVFNLNNLYPYNDEYSHLLAAKALLQGAPLNSVFDRSLLLVTLPVVISQRLFGIDLWSARLPGTIFNALAIIPLYLIVKKINKPVAILAGLLYASSPWIIAVARNVREHAYYPFYFFWIVYGMVVLLERLPDRLVLFKDWRKVLRPDLLILELALVMGPVYAVFIDARSAFKIIMLAYAVFGIFLLRKFDLRNKINLLALAVLGICLAVAGSVYAVAFGHSGLSLSPRFHADALAFFFPNPDQQWYFGRPALIPALALLAAGAICFLTIRQNLVPSFLAALLLACMLFFTIFFGYLVQPRYLIIMQLWFVVILALGLYGLFGLQLLLPRKDIVLPLTATALFALTFNISQSLLPTFYDKQGNMPITSEYHFNMAPANAVLLDKVSDKDVLISSMYAGYVRWKGSPKFAKIYSYGFTLYSLKYRWIFPYEAAETMQLNPRDYVLSIVGGNDSGWIVLDSINYSSKLTKPLPLKTTVVNDKEIEYLGYYGGEYIWRWRGATPAP